MNEILKGLISDLGTLAVLLWYLLEMQKKQSAKLEELTSKIDQLCTIENLMDEIRELKDQQQ